MAGWPKLSEQTRGLTFVTNIEEWTRRSGRAPTFTDLTIPFVNNPGVYSPIWLPKPMRAKKLYVFNGSVVNGRFEVSLSRSFASGQGIPAYPHVSSGPVTQAGANAIQTVDIADTWLEAGIWWLNHIVDSATAKYLCAWSASEANDAFGAGGVYSASGFPIGFNTGSGGNSIIPVCAIGGIA